MFLRNVLLLVPPLLLAACRGDVYVRDGVTDGDTFYLAPYALMDPDPVLQSWVRYSLAKSVCQLEIGGPNPARASSYECELRARRQLATAWAEQKFADPAVADPYLDDLARVHDAGFLPGYVAHYFGRRSWAIPPEVDGADFDRWRRRELGRHRPETRLIGSWNYAERVNSALSRQ